MASACVDAAGVARSGADVKGLWVAVVVAADGELVVEAAAVECCVGVLG